MEDANDKLYSIAVKYGYVFGCGVINEFAPYSEMLRLTDKNGEHTVVFTEEKDPDCVFLLLHIEQLQKKIDEYEKVFDQPSA